MHSSSARSLRKAAPANDRFVLALSYFLLCQTDAAVKQLEAVTQLQLGDKLSAQILAGLKSKPGGIDDRPTAPRQVNEHRVVPF